MANLSLVFDLVGRDVSASRAFKDVGDSAERAGKQGEAFGGKLASGLKLATGALLGAGLIQGFKSLYDAAAESAKIGRLTEAVIKSTGGAAQVSAKQVGDLAASLSKKTGIDDEAIQSSENLLLTFTNVRNEVGRGNDIFNQATGIIQDMSVALGQDSSSSAIQLGKALNDPIKGVTALQRVGVSFTASQRDQIKTLVESGKTMDAQKLILAELSKEFGGAAEAAATPFDKLKVNLGNLAETLGTNLIPYVNRFANFMMDDVLPAVQDVGGVVSGTLGPALSLAVDLFKGLFDVGVGVVHFIDDLPGPLKALAISLGAMAVLKGPIGAVFETIRDVGQTAAIRALYLKDALSSVSGAAGLATSGAKGLVGFFGGPWGLALTGATVGISLLAEAFSSSDEATAEATSAQRDFAQALKESKGVIDESVRASAAKAAQDADLLDLAESAGISLSRVTDAVLGNKDAYNEVTAAMQAYLQERLNAVNGNTEDAGFVGASEAAGKFQANLDKLAPTVSQTATDQRQLTSATSETGSAMGNTQAAMATFQQGLEDTADAASDARQQTDLFKTSLDVLTGQNVSLVEVQSQLQDALAAAKDAMDKEGGAVLDSAGALNLHTVNGRKAADVLLDVRNSGNELIATLIQQGATSAEVQAADAELRQSFINTATQMGISKQGAQNLANQILGIPAERSTTINADTKPATDALNALKADLAKMGAVATVQFNTANARDGFAGRRAFGGPIFGPGTGTSDSVPILASNGEHMITAKEVRAAGGHSAVAAWRKSLMQGYATGGPIAGYEIPVGLAQSTLANLKNKLMPAIAGPGGSVQRWAGLVAQVLGILGQPGSLVGAVLQLIKHESGGNPNAINLTDSNARAGHPSQGLMQTIPGTFAAYAGPYRGLGITNPLANIYAGLNYGIHRYGSIARIPGIASLAAGGGYRPYDSGGMLEPGYTLAYNGTGKAETVRTAEQEAALRGQPVNVRVFIGDRELTDIVRVEAEGVVTGALTGATNRSTYNG